MATSRLLKKILVAAGILAVVTAWLGFGESGFLHLYRMGAERREATERIRLLAGQNQALMEEINQLRTDLAYVESVARKELGLVRPNEVIYRFKREENRSPKTDSDIRANAQALKY